MITYEPGVCPPSALTTLERTRFFARQLVGPEDLTQDQLFFRDKLRRHNRLLHGWGVVCGGKVKRGEGDCDVVVSPCYALGPWGDEILIDRDVNVDLCRESPDGLAVSPCGDVDPWCGGVRVGRGDGTFYLAVRHAECQSRPVRVASNGCGCDEAECEYSRTRDSYAIKLLSELPSSHTIGSTGGPTDFPSAISCTGEGRECPDCPEEPWVVLADIDIDSGTIVDIDCYTHRRYIVSFAHYAFFCPGDSQPPPVARLTEVGREYADRGQSRVEAAPPATVPVRLSDDRWAVLPGSFVVEAGETFADLLAREGDRELIDSESDRRYLLRELYALARINPADTVAGVLEALVPLDGLRLEVDALRRARAELAELIDDQGLELLDRAHASALGEAFTLPATSIRGASPKSRLGERLAEMTVGEVAAMKRAEFVAYATAGVQGADQKTLETQARDVWSKAAQGAKLSRAWRRE